jgi:molecular chaperone GrpE
MSQPKPSKAPEQRTEEDGAAGDPGTVVMDDLEKLRARADERDQFLAMLQRTQADFDNYQKRNRREREEERRYYNDRFAEELLPVLDNLERAMAAATSAKEKGPLVQGVGMVHSQLLDLLRRHGITPIEALGQPFDPNLHQAVMQQPAPDKEPNTVLQVLEQGFKIHDRVLRPARVIVSSAG